MKILTPDRRVQGFLQRALRDPAYQWSGVRDPRARRGRRWKLSSLMNALFTGMLTGCPSLRDVETLTEELGETGRALVEKRVPDTTLWDLLGRLTASDLRRKLLAQVHSAWRSKSLESTTLPCGVLAIDGKGLGALEHDANGTAQKAHRAHDGTAYWLARMLRAVLVSADAKPCLDQMPIGSRTNEMGCAPEFLDRLLAAYGRGNLFEVVTLDAGLVSRALADQINAAHKAYVMALKGTQPELLAEAERLFRHRGELAAQTAWEPYQGKLVRRSLYRSSEIAGYHGWQHLRQVWLVVTETKRGEAVEEELRYFLTNLPAQRFSANQILAVVRAHWGIENDCFWTLDTQWKEDAVPWCSSGRAVEALSWIRLMAYNLMQLARRRHLRRRSDDDRVAVPPPAWRNVLRWVRDALRLDLPVGDPVCA